MRAQASAAVAAFGSPATDRLGRLLDSPVLVVAATGDPEAHARFLSTTRHAAISPCARGFDHCEAAAATYEHRPFDARWMGSSPLPPGVTMEAGCLRTRLPPGCSPADLGPLLATAMIERGYLVVGNRPSSVRRRLAAGRPLALAPCYALARPGEFGRVRLVDDVYAFRPRDLPAVAAAVALAASGLALRSLVSDARERSR